MRTGRPTPAIVLTAEERETLEQWARRPTTAQALAQRARIVLACATGKTNGHIAAAAGVTRQTVGRWRTRFELACQLALQCGTLLLPVAAAREVFDDQDNLGQGRGRWQHATVRTARLARDA